MMPSVSPLNAGRDALRCFATKDKGVRITVNSIGETKANVSRMRITLKGIDYLSNNPAMRKIAESTTGIVTIRFREQD